MPRICSRCQRIVSDEEELYGGVCGNCADDLYQEYLAEQYDIDQETWQNRLYDAMEEEAYNHTDSHQEKR